MREGDPAAGKQGRSRSSASNASSSSRLHQMLSSQQQQQHIRSTKPQPQQQQRQDQLQQQQQQQQQQQHQQQQRQRKAPEPLRRAVADCLSVSQCHPLSSQPLRTLQDYLGNPSTIHFAYTVLLEHAIAERDRSPPVVIKCVSLLKRYLFRYVPSITTLQQIDSFCAALIREANAAAEKKSSASSTTRPPPNASANVSAVFASDALVKSLVYVRAVVARHLPGFSLQQQQQQPSFKLTLSQPSPLHHYVAKESSTPRPALLDPLLAALPGVDVDGSSELIAADLLKWRWIARKGTQVWTPSPVMLDSGGIARPQVESLKNVEQGVAAIWLANANAKQGESQFVRASTAAAIADGAAVKSHLRDVAASKRHLSSRWAAQPLTTIRKRQRPLFQYRYYSKQQPLRLSEADIEEVIAAVCAEATAPVLPSLAQNCGETANVAGSVLIKLMIDMYLADAKTAAPLALSILQVMLGAAPVVVRVRAFDLVLNLGVHAHLLEPMQSDDPEASQAAFCEGTPRAVGDFEAWLFTIVCEMLLFLVQLEEKDEGVWAAALSSLLYLVCDRGHIRRERLERVDIRVLRKLLDVSRDNAWAEQVHCRLIRMLSNLLFVSPSAHPTLDADRLEAAGGMELICREYALANSSEIKRNLFTVMLEYAVCQLRDCYGKGGPGEDEVQAIATALVLAGAPESISVALKHKLCGIGGRIAKSVIKALDRDIANGRLNVTVLEEVARWVDVLVDKHGSLDEELRELVTVSMEGQDDISYLASRGWTILHALLHSPRCDYRQHGHLWLKHLLEAEAECLHGRRKEETGHEHCIYKMVEQGRVEGFDSATKSPSHLLFGLLKSRKQYVRQGFFTVFEHLLSQCQRMGCTDEEHGGMLVWLMSGSLWHFISANDTNRVNILQMCNLVLSQILCRLNCGVSSDMNTELAAVVVSSPAALFLREEAGAPHKFVSAMPTDVFYWPLMQLAGGSMDDVSLGIAVGSKGGGNVPGCASDVRAALLLLLVAKCTLQQAALEEVGGQEFFRSLLDDTDARIAYYTASFLIKRMMMEDADNYQRVLHNLVFKAQQKNDEKLLENPYLQIGGILQLDPDLKAPLVIQDDGQ